MRTIETKAELRAALAEPRRKGLTIGLVPTMGALHAGHRSLLDAARRDCDVVVMSLFVNPAQFGPGEDLERYPAQPQERDAAIAADAGVDLLYAPAVERGLPRGVRHARRGRGAHRRALRRPRPARGRALPRRHHRGRQAPQRRRSRRRLLRPEGRAAGDRPAGGWSTDLDFPVRIEVMPTVREPDGLAMSSRNAYLDPAERERAAALRRALLAAERTAAVGRSDAEAHRGGDADPRRRRDRARVPGGARRRAPSSPSRPSTESRSCSPSPRSVGGARLIDNVLIEPNRAGDAVGAS